MVHLDPYVKWREIKGKKRKKKKGRKVRKGEKGPFGRKQIVSVREERKREKVREERFRERNSIFSLRFTKIGMSFFIRARGKVHLRDESFT